MRPPASHGGWTASRRPPTSFEGSTSRLFAIAPITTPRSTTGRPKSKRATFRPRASFCRGSSGSEPEADACVHVAARDIAMIGAAGRVLAVQRPAVEVAILQRQPEPIAKRNREARHRLIAKVSLVIIDQ